MQTLAAELTSDNETIYIPRTINEAKSVYTIFLAHDSGVQ